MPRRRIGAGARLVLAIAAVGCVASAFWTLRPCASVLPWQDGNYVVMATPTADVATASPPSQVAVDGDASAVRTAASFGPSAGSPDSEWEREVRNAADLVLAIVRAPADAGVGLLRSLTFNPRDVFVAPENRELLDRLVARRQSAAKALATEFERAARSEFEAALARGDAQKVAAEELFGGGRAGPDPFYRPERGEVIAVPRASMPLAAVAQARARELGAELVADLATAAAGLGLLTDDERQRLLLRAVDARRIGPTPVPATTRR